MTDLRAQILAAFHRAASVGRGSLSPSMVCDYSPPGERRMPYAAVCRELQALWEDGVLNEARVGAGRYTLAPAPYVAADEQMTLGETG